MMNELKVLYVLYVPPGRVRTLLDAIRLFARPQTKHPAHITVRGPYPDYQDPRDWSAKIRGRRIEVGGVGTFFGPQQHTVYLRAESPMIRELWDKPDYPSGLAHLSIYNGESRSFADALTALLAERNPQFAFTGTGLEPLVMGNGPRLLRAGYDPSELTAFLDRPPTLDELDSADEKTRLAWI